MLPLTLIYTPHRERTIGFYRRYRSNVRSPSRTLTFWVFNPDAVPQVLRLAYLDM